MAKGGIFEPIVILPGVQPDTDMTAVATQHYTYADKIRFTNGYPQKIKGWISNAFDYAATIDGTARTLFTAVINGRFLTIIGTNKKLYSLIGSQLTNITPLLTTTETAANSLDTHYATLASNPFSATNASPVITVSDTEAALFKVGDLVTFSGATGFAGITAGALNTTHIVRSIGVNVYTINVGTNANATTTGGGASVVRSSGLITVNKATHGMLNGDRVKMSGAANTGGILAAAINTEFIIRNKTTNTFDIFTTGTATSSVTAGGGASTVYYKEIPAGALDEANVIGYGAGLYGMGLYGTALVSSTSRAYPRIWFADRYANTIIATPGNQTGLYQWAGSTTTAPVLITNAPTAINYAFVSDNIIVTFGAGGTENRIFSCDQNAITVWSSSSTNQVYDDDIEGAGRLISHAPVEDYNLIFTENSTYSFRYIGLPLVWEIKPVDETIGIIAPNARVSVKGMAFWMGLENFYMYRGGTVEVIPANTQNESTCLNYVFGDINWGQKSKFFAWFNNDNSEVWFHYASANSNECDRVVVVDILDFVWTIHTLDRTCAESPGIKLRNPRLINVGTLYQHEIGYNDDTSPMTWTLTGKKNYYGRENVNINRIIPDNVLTGTMDLTIDGSLFPQSSASSVSETYGVTSTTEQVPFLPSTSRFYQYTWAGNDLDQQWIMGQWIEELQKGATE